MRTGIAAEAAAESGLMKLAPHMKPIEPRSDLRGTLGGTQENTQQNSGQTLNSGQRISDLWKILESH